MSQADALGAVLDQLQLAGLDVTAESLDTTGRLIRVRTTDDPASGRKRSGWYVINELRTRDGAMRYVGRFGNWRIDDPNGRGLKVADRGLSAEEVGELRALQKAAKQRAREERERKAAEAAQRAAELWGKLPDAGRSDYLDRKGVGAYGLRFARGTVVVPVATVAGKLVGLQFIGPDGGKKFLTGTAKAGAYHLIGDLGADAPVAVAEGYATGATIHMATGWPVAVVFDAGNIMPVAKSLREALGMRQLVIAGDDDHEATINVGAAKANEVAKSVKALAVFPRFEDPAGRTDFNDMHAEQGLDAVADCLRGALAGSAPPAPPGMPPDNDLGGFDEPWHQQLVTNDKGALLVTLHNVITVLTYHPEWRGVLVRNDFKNAIQFNGTPPIQTDERTLTDSDFTDVAAWFGRPDTYAINVPTRLVEEAVLSVARQQRFHPIRDYLDSLQWDGVERLPTLFSDFFGSEQTEYTAAVGVNFFVSAAARARRPGCKADLMLVLEGEQGLGKSTACEVLAGTEWFAEAMESPQSKDFYQSLTGRWIVEIGEFHSFSKAEVSKVKQAISCKVDIYRPSYGRAPQEFGRQCVFIGTTNDDQYLRDPTGARRFMPVRVREVNTEALRQLRDQIWAEADHRLAQGECYWKLPEAARAEQDARYMEDSWADPIRAWLEGKAADAKYSSTEAGKIKQATISRILHVALDMDYGKHTRQDQMRVGAILKRMGWTRKQARINGVPTWVYARPEDEEQAAS